MTHLRRILRWLPTFLAFPLGGLLAIVVVGPTTTVAAGLLAGAILGVVLGGAQWLALRSSGVGRSWWAATAVAAAVATALCLAMLGPGTEPGDLALRGAVTGLFVGAAQAFAMRTPLGPGLAWALVTALSWAGAWVITSQVIVDLERGYVVFGATGALAATIVTGVALPLVVGRRKSAEVPTGVRAVNA